MKNIILILIISALLSCNKNDSEIIEKDDLTKENYILSDKEIELNKIEFIDLEKKIINDKVNLSGKVDVNPNDKISIYSKIDGIVKSINVIQGDNVKKGDFLFEIENSKLIDMKSDFIETTNNFNQIEMEFIRQKELYEQKAISEKEFIDIDKKYKNTLNHLNYMKKRFEYLGINYKDIYSSNDLSYNLKVKSEVNGQVGEIEINNGKYIEMNDLAMEIYSNSHLHVEVQAPSNYINSFSEGDNCNIKFQSKDYEGKIFKISKIINDKNNMFLIHIHFSKDVNIPIGTYVKVEIESNSIETFVLNKEFIFDLDSSPFVYLYEEGKVIKKKIKIGKVSEDYVEVLNSIDFVSKKIIGQGVRALSSKII